MIEKVFDVDTFQRYCRRIGINEKTIEFHMQWAAQCQGLTKEYIEENLKLDISDEWLIQIEK